MRIGEKIKSFRALKNMTQKELGEKSGIGEATIRKYELGIRNPKPAQIKKIAQALELNEIVFYDIPLSSLQLDTIGEVMSLIFLLDDRIGFDYLYQFDENGIIDANSIALHLKNAAINQLLARWITENSMVQTNAFALRKVGNQLSATEVQQQQLAIDQFILESTKSELAEKSDPIK